MVVKIQKTWQWKREAKDRNIPKPLQNHAGQWPPKWPLSCPIRPYDITCQVQVPAPATHMIHCQDLGSSHHLGVEAGCRGVSQVTLRFTKNKHNAAPSPVRINGYVATSSWGSWRWWTWAQIISRGNMLRARSTPARLDHSGPSEPSNPPARSAYFPRRVCRWILSCRPRHRRKKSSRCPHPHWQDMGHLRRRETMHEVWPAAVQCDTIMI